MKIYFESSLKSPAIDRVITNLARYIPNWATRVYSKDEADLIVLHAYGRKDHLTLEAMSILKNGQDYAVIQYALKSTRNPDPHDWNPLWLGSKVVWSYYDLGQFIPNSYLTPLAADPEVFLKKDSEKTYLVGTLGSKSCYHAECFGEVHLAAYQASGKVVHIGEMINPNPIVKYISDFVTDTELCNIYNSCNWFSALRRKEGFEMIAVEALLCGVRPIMFASPDYLRWFDGLAEFIPEDSVAHTVTRLRKLLKSPTKPLSADEIQEAKKRFNWQQIIIGFYEKCTT